MTRISPAMLVCSPRLGGICWDLGNPDKWSRAMRRLMPTVNFIQKAGPSQRGQAYSLNRIMQMLKDKGAKYWLHWEESWQADAPFLERAISAMEASGALQVELGVHKSTSDAHGLNALNSRTVGEVDSA